VGAAFLRYVYVHDAADAIVRAAEANGYDRGERFLIGNQRLSTQACATRSQTHPHHPTHHLTYCPTHPPSHATMTALYRRRRGLCTRRGAATLRLSLRACTPHV
jgi:nucleoside-diphosphate-sugar epimerase